MRSSGAYDPMSRLPLALMITGLLILVIGGSIRINDAGESCPEWPTCFGKIHPFVSAEEQLQWWEENPEEARKQPHDIPEVQCKDLQSIFEEQATKHFNLISIDVESMELQVLKTIDFSKVTFDVMLIESDKSGAETRAFMKEIDNYELVKYPYVPRSDVYVHLEFKRRIIMSK